jgi:hypothetical protein
MECNDPPQCSEIPRMVYKFVVLCRVYCFRVNTFPFMIVAPKILLGVLQIAFLILSVTVKLAGPKDLEKFSFRHVLIFA